jgi:putative heme iron utilization protein
MSDGIAAGTERLSRLKQALAAEPGGILEEIARREGATYREILDALPEGEAVSRPGSAF